MRNLIVSKNISQADVCHIIPPQDQKHSQCAMSLELNVFHLQKLCLQLRDRTKLHPSSVRVEHNDRVLIRRLLMLRAAIVVASLRFVKGFDRLDVTEIALDCGGLVVDLVEWETLAGVCSSRDRGLGRVDAGHLTEGFGVEDLDVKQMVRSRSQMEAGFLSSRMHCLISPPGAIPSSISSGPGPLPRRRRIKCTFAPCIYRIS